MKNLYESFREYVKNTIDFEKKKMLLLTKEELNHIKMGTYVISVKKEY